MSPAAPAAMPGLRAFLRAGPDCLRTGPIALILVEDDAALAETVDHHARLGFRHILLASPEPLSDLPGPHRDRLTNVIWNTRRPAAHVEAVNLLIQAVPPGTWLYYGFNAEFLFYPFSDRRSVKEMLDFHGEERRSAMLSYVIDLYAPDLGRCPDGVSLDEAMFDGTGYCALPRHDDSGRVLERQLDFHGGLRWRYEELLPRSRLTIDRIALFRATPRLQVTADHRFNEPEYNTYACKWHHSLTSAIASFRVAKALRTNPGSRDQIDSFVWRHSRRFDWQPQQLMDLGLMEPGQWF